jgi:hypothetical protein
MPDAVFKLVHSLYHDTTASVQNVLFALIAAVLTWSCWSAFYNVYLHPLARFPGPKLAAASKYWLFYQEFVKGVSLSDVRDELHAQYGTLRFFSPAPLLATLSTRHWHSPSIELTLIWHVRLTGDIIRVQPNLVRRRTLSFPEVFGVFGRI